MVVGCAQGHNKSAGMGKSTKTLIEKAKISGIQTLSKIRAMLRKSNKKVAFEVH